MDLRSSRQVGAYLRHAAGWTSNLTTLAPGQLSLQAGSNDFAIRRKSANEYFLVENRAPAGRDAMLGGGGLAIWHVDELADNENQQGTPALHYECALVQADGLRELERGIGLGDPNDLFRGGHNAQFTPASNPNSNWWSGSPSALKITGISAAGPAMSFLVT